MLWVTVSKSQLFPESETKTSRVWKYPCTDTDNCAQRRDVFFHNLSNSASYNEECIPSNSASHSSEWDSTFYFTPLKKDLISKLNPYLKIEKGPTNH
jgi:hypothetical protein